MLCRMLREARDGVSENVMYGHTETGLRHSGEAGRACPKPEVFVCTETLNLPGGQHTTPRGSQGADSSKPPQCTQK